MLKKDGIKFQKIFEIQSKKREQVSKNEKRFNEGKTKEDLQHFKQVCEGTLFRKMPILTQITPTLSYLFRALFTQVRIQNSSCPHDHEIRSNEGEKVI